MIDINSLIMTAMKSGEKTKSETYRQIKAKFLEWRTSKEGSAYLNKESAKLGIEVKDIPIPEDTEMSILSKMVKQYNDAIKEFETNGATDLAKQYSAELEIIRELVPPDASFDDIVAKVNDVCNSLVDSGHEVSMKDMKTIMTEVKKTYPTADGGDIAKAFKMRMTLNN